MTVGAAIYGIVKDLDRASGTNSVDITSDHFVARCAGRLIEETVELALSFGLKPNEVLGHVADAIHNECRKAGTFPSQLMPATDRDEQLTELADVLICHDLLRYIRGIPSEAVDIAAAGKLEKLQRSVVAGDAVIVDGLLYRKIARGIV